MQIVALVEDLATDIRVYCLQLANLLVLLGDELLVHRGDLDEQVVVGKVEIGGEPLGRLTVRVEDDREATRLVFPGNTVEVQEECELPLTVVSEVCLGGREVFGVQGAPASTTPG